MFAFIATNMPFCKYQQVHNEGLLTCNTTVTVRNENSSTASVFRTDTGAVPIAPIRWHGSFHSFTFSVALLVVVVFSATFFPNANVALMARTLT